ncbi:MAG TPA: hypothetical protein VHM90_17330, partial [Phycisphaerae bacterium]|nr:hypothetical protein [Phycisphaerae bacterium]
MALLSDWPRVLEEAGYERAFLARVAEATSLRGVDVQRLEEMTLEVSGASILGRVFYMGRTVGREDLEGVLSGELCEALMDEGILREVGEGMVKAECAVVPARGFWLLRDFDG